VTVAATAVSLADDHPRRWRTLALIATAELLGMSLWFAGTAVAPQLGLRWAAVNAAGWLTTMVQFGFVCGTAGAALLNLADLLPSRWYFAVSAVLASVANASLLSADDFACALAGRFLTGFCLAGVYPPAMKMAATWFRTRRGVAIGTVVGALTIGKATPYLVHAFPDAQPAAVVLTASVCALVAAPLIAIFYRDGPYPFAPRPFSWNLVAQVVSGREWRLATGGYLGHMFELFSFWTWIPAFIAASFARSRVVEAGDQSLAFLLGFASIAIGGAGCVWGGFAADRRGRERLVMLAMAVSGSCALLVPLAFGRSLWLLAPLVLTWGFFVVADSAQFSALVTESVAPHAVGTALTVQTSLGFLLTIVSIQLVPPIVSFIGWRWAFPVLALGPAAGILSIKRLRQVKRPSAAATGVIPSP